MKPIAIQLVAGARPIRATSPIREAKTESGNWLNRISFFGAQIGSFHVETKKKK